MIQARQNKYLETAVQTASPAQLLIMLCDGAIRFTKASIEALHRKQYEDANNNLCRVQDIIKEFMSTLKPDAAVSDGLFRLYEYFLFQLVEANRLKEAGPAEEVLGYLIELKETWVQAARSISSTQSGTTVKHG